nr:ankyrin repeat and KH domain containing protein [Hymenolepis microstoma]
MSSWINENPFFNEEDVNPMVYPAHHIEVGAMLNYLNSPQIAQNSGTHLPNIHYATQSNNLDMMLQFIHQRNETDEFGNTPLHYAAANGFKPAVFLLLAHHDYVDPINNVGLTPLTTAVMNNHIEVARILMDAGASPYYFTRDAQSPLTVALALNQFGLVHDMLSRPCLHLFRQLALNYALSDAASKSNPLCAQLLLSQGADIAYPMSNTLHPLNISVLMGDLDMVVTWINAKAPLERRDPTGLTPLMNAARRGFYDVCIILVMNGADVWARNKGKTAFTYAFYSGYSDIATFLLHCMQSTME